MFKLIEIDNLLLSTLLIHVSLQIDSHLILEHLDRLVIRLYFMHVHVGKTCVN